MLAIVFGFVAAVCWATALMASARSARMIGPWATLAWVMLLGLVLTLPLLALSGPVSLTGAQLVLLAVSGVANLLGLLAVYAAVRGGKVAVVAPIVSTEGALAAVIAVALGEPLAAGAGFLLSLLVIGIVLASTERVRVEDRTRPRTVGFAIAAAGLFAINLYAAARLGADLPLAWAVLPPRLVGTVVVALPLLLARRLPFRRDVFRYLGAVAVAEVAGTASFAFGARDGIAVASVMASQFGAIAAIVSVVFFGERLGRLQVAGVGLIAVGVAALSALRT